MTVSKFATADGAQKALNVLEGLQRQQLIRIDDAAVVSWPEGAKQPQTSNMHNLTGAGAVGGAFWGMLFGLIFFMPFLGAVVDRVADALKQAGLQGELISSNLSTEQEQQLRAAFGTTS